MQCGGEDPEDSYMCLAYFICLDLNIDYTAIVRIRGDKRSVSAAVTMEAVEECEFHLLSCSSQYLYILLSTFISITKCFYVLLISSQVT